MIMRIGPVEFVLTPDPDSDRRVIAVRQIDGPEICIDMTKQQATTLANALQAWSK